MPVEGVSLFRTREEIRDDLQAAVLAIIPDAYFGPDGNLTMLLEILSGSMESVFLANQIVVEDMFIQTANEIALDRYGVQYAVPRKTGTRSVGTLRFGGAGGTVISVGSEVAYDPGTGDDLLYFTTTVQGIIPNPGSPLAPTVAVNAVAGNLTGAYDYVITFVTAGGETKPGADSIAVNPVAQKVDISAIPTGGPGTTARKIYRQKNGSGVYNLVTTLADNTTTVYTDNIADGSVGAVPLTVSTAQAIAVAAQSDDFGSQFNVLTGTIKTLTDVPDGVTDVSNTTAFVGGTDEEGFEDFRSRLLNAIQNPATGSANDIKTWAEEVDGVGQATVFPNDNAGTPTNGHVTVRISAPDGSAPSSTVQSAVLAAILARDLANITIHVTTFSTLSTDVSVTVTLDTGYLLSDVTPGVVKAITDYMNGLAVGGTFRVNGLIAALMFNPGVLDVAITVPSGNLTTPADTRRIVGTVIVS
jgi:uncharacterized phage protein gp47/JayE